MSALATMVVLLVLFVAQDKQRVILRLIAECLVHGVMIDVGSTIGPASLFIWGRPECDRKVRQQ
jgi:hypothetical protein